MKIVLICMGGITTNILAKKMQAYADQHGIAIEVHAVSYQNFTPYIKDATVIFIAPQIHIYLDKVQKVVNDECPIYELQESDIIQPDFQRIFQQIPLDQYHESKDTKIIQMQEIEKSSFSILSILKQSFLALVPLFFFAIGLIVLCEYREIVIVQRLYEAFVPVFALYVIVAVSYCFGKETKQDPLSFVFLSLACCLMLLPIHTQRYLINGEKVMDLGYIPTSFMGIMMLPVVYIVALFASMLAHISRSIFRYSKYFTKFNRNKNHHLMPILNFINAFPDMLTLSIFLLLRLLISLFITIS